MIRVRFQIRRFLQAFASSAIVEIVISNPDFDGANRLALGSHFAEETIRYGPEFGQYPILIGNVFGKGFLRTPTFRCRSLWNNKTVVDALGELPKLASALSCEQGELLG